MVVRVGGGGRSLACFLFSWFQAQTAMLYLSRGDDFFIVASYRILDTKAMVFSFENLP